MSEKEGDGPPSITIKDLYKFMQSFYKEFKDFKNEIKDFKKYVLGEFKKHKWIK